MFVATPRVGTTAAALQGATFASPTPQRGPQGFPQGVPTRAGSYPRACPTYLRSCRQTGSPAGEQMRERIVGVTRHRMYMQACMVSHCSFDCLSGHGRLP